MTTSSLPLLPLFSLLFNYHQLSLVVFVSSGRRSGGKKGINRLLPRSMQIFAQTPLSR